MKKTVIVAACLLLSCAPVKQAEPVATPEPDPPPPPPSELSIDVQRQKEYPGGPVEVIGTLASNPGYKRFLVSYPSDGLKIHALLAQPDGTPPDGGWPIIILNHGYIAPETYVTGKYYYWYVDFLVRQGYVVFMSDYRGHAESEGDPEGGYYSPGYTTDVLNGISSVKTWPNVNPDRIGMWSHSMGGHIALRVEEIDPSVKASVIWGGVVGSYQDIYELWWSRPRAPFQPSAREQTARSRMRTSSRANLEALHGSPVEGNPWWDEISPIRYITDVSIPIQLHHGLADQTVPFALSERFYNKVTEMGRTAEYYTYEGSDHNISQSFNLAMKRTAEFFARNVK